jgi:hypothetical protein
MNIADPMIKRTEFCLNLNVAQGLFTIVIQSRVIITISLLFIKILNLKIFCNIFLKIVF